MSSTSSTPFLAFLTCICKFMHVTHISTYRFRLGVAKMNECVKAASVSEVKDL